MSIVDLSVVDKETKKPASRVNLERYLSTLCEDIEPVEGDDSRSVSYSIGEGTIVVEYLRRQTFVTIIGGENGSLADRIINGSNYFNWHPSD